MQRNAYLKPYAGKGNGNLEIKPLLGGLESVVSRTTFKCLNCLTTQSPPIAGKK